MIVVPMDQALPDQTELKALLQYSRVLADEKQMRLLGALMECEQRAADLATLLKMRVPDVSRSLEHLCWLGLVRQRPDSAGSLYRFDATGLQRLGRASAAVSKETFGASRPASAADDAEGEEWERRVLQSFFEGERLTQIPASYKKLVVVLRWLVQRFDEHATYPEREVNAILKRHHPDFATLRRELVDAGFMYRQNGVYWRLPLPALAERLPQ